MITTNSKGESLPTGVPDAFLSAYITCALWSSMDESDESGGEPLDENYSESDLAPETRDAMLTDCANFLAECEEAGVDPFPEYGKEWPDIEMSAQDFWLTRNRHGAGYWDRGLPDDGKALTEIAHNQGSADLYVGDDGLIYQS